MEDDDPRLAAVAGLRRPRVRTDQLAYARLQHRAALDELAGLEQELETLCARRRSVARRLESLRGRVRPAMLHRYRRRRRVDEVPMPPARVDAVPVGGVELRAAGLALLRRHGPCALPELHGLLHRYGMVIESSRPVQRLADALAYEVRQGRCVRVERGVYAAVSADEVPGAPEPALPTPEELLPWADPNEEPTVDPAIANDPERWGPEWPLPAVWADDVEAPYPPSDLDETVRRARRRAAALAADRLRTEIENVGHDNVDPDGPLLAHWQRFVDESSPTDRRRLAWEQPEWRGPSWSDEVAAHQDDGPLDPEADGGGP